jgi:hypothetical protein
MLRIILAVMMLSLSGLAYDENSEYAHFIFSKTGPFSYEYTFRHAEASINGKGSDPIEAYNEFFSKMKWDVVRSGDHIQIFDKLTSEGWEMLSLNMAGDKKTNTFRRQWLFKREIE